MTQQTAPAPKLCINCKHYQPGAKFGGDEARAAEYSKCAAIVTETNESLTYVDGRALVITYAYCDHARRIGGKCSPDAKLFESAEVTEAA